MARVGPDGYYLAWADDFLHLAGFPTCDNNRVAVVAWAFGEGTSARNNPLATTMNAPGATAFNHINGQSGVKNYPDRAVGMDATIRTIRLSPYTGIVSALKRCAPPTATAAAVGASPWGTSGALMTSTIPAARKAVGAGPAAGKSGDASALPTPPGADAVAGAVDSVARSAADVVGSLGGLVDFLALLGRWDTWARVLYVTGGAGLVVAGLVIVNRDAG